MDLDSPKKIKKVLKKQPAKKLGQNFLINEDVVKDIIEIAEITKKDTVLEIGPGLGAITKELTKKAKKVVAIEKDSQLINHLNSLEYKNLTVVNDDFFNVDLDLFLEGEYKVVANLPFNAATAIIREVLTTGGFSSISVITQKEVAERIESKGNKENFLSVITKVKGEPEVCRTVPRNYFWPAPRVDGAVLKIVPRLQNENSLFYKEFFKIVEAGFRHSRKQLKNNLANFNGLTKKDVVNLLKSLDLNPKIRAEDLEVSDWEKMTKRYLTLTRKENKINQDEDTQKK